MKKNFFIICLLSVSNVFSQPIFVTTTAGNLYSLDLLNCTSHLIGQTGHGFADIAFTPDGKLWGIEGGVLYQINTTNANTTVIGATGTQAVSLVALNNSTLFAEYETKLYGVNTANATDFLIGDIGYKASGDLTWYDNDLYMTSGSSLIKIILNNTFTTILTASPVNSNGNLIPTCEGAVAASFPSLNNSIIGFSGNNVYKICQIDGSSQLLCTAIVPEGIPGAASMTLPSQNPKPTACFGSKPQTQNFLTVIRNPSIDKTVIETNFDLQDATLIVYNAIGQKVKQITHLTGRTVSIYHQNLAAGVYFIRLQLNGQKQIVEKLVFTHN
jgi:hypothetical protein